MDPELKRSVVELDAIRDIAVKEARVRLPLALTTMACPLKDSITGDVL